MGYIRNVSVVFQGSSFIYSGMAVSLNNYHFPVKIVL